MTTPDTRRGHHDQLSLFLVAVVLVVIFLLTGLLVANRSLQRSIKDRADLDATTSAAILADQVELTGAKLHEASAGIEAIKGMANIEEQKRRIQVNSDFGAIWIFDSTASIILDSADFGSVAYRNIDSNDVRNIARDVAQQPRIWLRAISSRKHEAPKLALLAEPISDKRGPKGIAVALVAEESLLAPAARVRVKGRAFLALLVNGDTAIHALPTGSRSERSNAAPVPLPGRPEWFVVSGQTTESDETQAIIWMVGVMILALVSLGLIREHRQTQRIAERSIELERLSAELLRANRTKSAFLASVSHELRTPLNAIVGFVDLLRDGAYGDLSIRQISPVERIATSANRLRSLVDEVLDIAKIAAGRLDVRVEPVTLRPFLINVVREMEPLVNERGLTASVAVMTEELKIRTDPTHLRQILINLLGNAVKYTRVGTIELRARVSEEGPDLRSLAITGQHAIAPVPMEQHQKWLAIDVIDTGMGIPQVDQERVFEEFEQVRSAEAMATGQRGTGLGLPISRRLAVLLGGDITVESEIGKGSTFTVWLPLQEGV
jgi:signal transduction histidine kinase